MIQRDEPEKVISLIQRNAEFSKRKKGVIVLLDKVEAKVLNVNNGYSITVIDELLSLIKARIDLVSMNHEHILEAVSLRLEEILGYKNYDDFEDYITAKLFALEDFFKIYENVLSLQNEYLNESVNIITQKVDLELKKIRELRNRLQNTESENIYDYADEKFSNAKHNYLGLFFVTIMITISFAVGSLVFKEIFFERFKIDKYDYWVLKITIFSLCVTVLSFFLRQVIHYQKKADYAEKISLELQAFPSYISDLEPLDSIQLRKELAHKYFGNQTIDSSNKSSDFNLEQMKSTTEMVKATTEAIKILNSKRTSE